MSNSDELRIDQLRDLDERELLGTAEKSVLAGRTEDVKLIEFELWRRGSQMSRGTAFATTSIAGLALVIATEAIVWPQIATGSLASHIGPLLFVAFAGGMALLATWLMWRMFPK